MTESPDIFLASIRDLTSAFNEKQSAREVHYIFHTAFCCSTLLARQLGSIPTFFVLKEPAVLDQIAELLYNPNNVRLCNSQFNIADILRVTMALLARTYSSNQVAVIKTSDYCLGIGGHLAHHNSNARVVFLSSPLRAFLLSVLKCPKRREWARIRLDQSAINSTANIMTTRVPTETMTDGQVAASLWVLYRSLFERLRSTVDPTRIMSIDSDLVAAYPLVTLRDVTRFLGRPVSTKVLLNALSHDVCNVHSKDLTLPYDNAARQDEFRQGELHFGAEADEAIRWVHRWCYKVMEEP